MNGDTMAYDAENRLKTATEPASLGSGVETYLYDGLGQRVEKTGPDGTTVYAFDTFGQLIAEYGTNGPPAPCTTCYLVSDPLGTARLVTDEDANIIARHDYLPFGEEIAGGTAGRNELWGPDRDTIGQKFTGQIRDSETGQDFFNARYFTAALGRFTSPDPKNKGANPSNPQTWNAYSYVANNPLARTDPSGMVDVDDDPDSGGWSGDPIASGGGGGGLPLIPSGGDASTPGLGGCTLGGTSAPCSLVLSAIGAGAAVQCPNNFCSGFAPVGNGNIAYVQYTAPANGPATYRALTTPVPDPSLPQNQAYAAYALDCQHSATPCNGNDQVTTPNQGLTSNYALANSTLNSASVTGMIPDPLTGEHFGNASWYDWSLIGTGHIATFNGDVESHFDTFSPIFLTPLHFLFDVLPSYFINPKPGVPGPTYTCSPGLGCH